MNLVRSIIAILCFAGLVCGQVGQHDTTGAPAGSGEHQAREQGGGGAGETAQQAGRTAQQAGGTAESAQHDVQVERGTLEMPTADFFMGQYGHLVAHPFGGHAESTGAEAGHGAVSPFTFYNVNLFQLIVLGLMLVVFGAVLVSFRSGRTTWILRVFRGWCRWIRDEMVYPVMGKEEGRKFTPFFIYLFFFIAFLNLIGLVPSSVTATACVFVTAALAIITFAVMVVGGMMQQGVIAFWKHLLPHGLPLWLVPLMFVLEVLGLVVKPFALTIRLFANMLAGHLVIYSFIGMIFVAAKMLQMSGWTWVVVPLPVAMGVFISIIEGFVALLQAYIFTYLSIIFVQQSLHPAH